MFTTRKIKTYLMKDLFPVIVDNASSFVAVLQKTFSVSIDHRLDYCECMSQGVINEYLIMICIILAWMLLGFLVPVQPAAVLETTTRVADASTTAAPKTVRQVEKEIEGMLTAVSKMGLPYFVRNSDLKLSAPCMSTFIKIFMDVRKLKLPAIKLLDAMAKPPPGLLKGTFAIAGDYDECLEVSATKKGDVPRSPDQEFWHGRYCLLEVDFPTALVDTIQDYNDGKANLSAFGKMGSFIAEFPATNFARSYFKYRIGVCMPSTCSEADLGEVLRVVPVDFLPMRVKRCEDSSRNQMHTDQAVFIAFLILFGLMVVFGTTVEAWYYLRQPGFNGFHKDRFVQFLLSFSLYANTKKLMRPEKARGGGEIPAVNGMYVIGTVLVTIYHAYFMPFFLQFSSHGGNLGEYLKDWKFTLIATMGISIEAYFLFSGLFLTYPRFRNGDKDVNVNVLKIIVRRYLRLCPSMLVILGIIVFLPLVGSGPFWAEVYDPAVENTRKWWWTYALMFNNFLEVKDQNFLYLWFIPCLMQVSIVGAFLLWIIAKSRKLGIALTILAGLGCNVALGVLTAFRHYPPTYAIYYYHNREHFETTIYTSPLSHAFSFGIGMLLGLYMAKNPTLKMSKTHVVVGWIASLALTTGTQFVVFSGHEGKEPNPIFAGIFAATHRTLFSLGLSWMILACSNGYGGAFAKVLSWKGFGVLSKLGYLSYLTHYIILTYHSSSSRIPLMFSHHEIFYRVCAYTVLTFFAAYILYVTFEVPLVFVESLFLPSARRRPETNNNGPEVLGKGRPEVTNGGPPKYADFIQSARVIKTWNDILPYPDEKDPEHSKL